MTSAPRYSVIVPVYNRPDEIRELLQSLTEQTVKDFEVIIVEDGSTQRCDSVVDEFREHLDLHYVFKPNTGPGPSRNLGFSQAKGEYLVVFDSDCIIPPHYFESVDRHRQNEMFDAWGGPDRSHESFTPLQQAMAFSMSSVLTTGGIRGGEKRIGVFQPRSFNMGISRAVYEKTRGFAFSRLAEDIELSVRMKQAGFRSVLISDAFVYHKRRATLSGFYKQVSDFGRGRVQVGRLYPDEIKPVHWLPSLFTLGLLTVPFLFVVNRFLFIAGVFLVFSFSVAVFLASYMFSKNVAVALWSVPASFVQLVGYGTGFLSERFRK